MASIGSLADLRMYDFGKPSSLGHINFSVRTSRDVIVGFARVSDFWVEVNLSFINSNTVLFSVFSCPMSRSYIS